MAPKALPRRKVVSSYENRGFWQCQLSCGHTEPAYGIRQAGNPVPAAPKTCGCHQCANLQNEEVATSMKEKAKPDFSSDAFNKLAEREILRSGLIGPRDRN